ncbi:MULTISPECIES: universal stress protein [unclassified Arthrobacter]|uniref:universal stress protein n=1 Tax=Arthrobacter sp. Leaf234 TaxID=1736303 RepID=UPI0006FEA460|nr:universal stress protein [Arthrobacter sp. Leaf234]KQO03691.1 universal stress protein UspA [Arthrobacter sp. Leaf234]
MRYIVGYTADERGHDAVCLAVALARRQDADLDLVLVTPEHSVYAGTYPPDQGFDTLLSEQMREWMDQGLALVPDDVTARGVVIRAESNAEGLIRAAEDTEASLIVIGASSRGLAARFSVGNVARGLLHAAPVPVALAPRGYRRTEPATRLTCAVGRRAGADDVISVAVSSAERRGLPLRLVSLVALDAGQPDAGGAEDEANRRLAEAASSLAAGGRVSVETAHGSSIEEAVEAMAWDEGEVLLVGSSRLAQHMRLFLGSTANKILRTLTIPMVVVPRTYATPGTTSGPGTLSTEADA